jgi:hypothetical protein
MSASPSTAVVAEPDVMTSIVIAAPPSLVYSILLDIPGYPRWISMFVKASASPSGPDGSLAVGDALHLALQPASADKKPFEFSPRITAIEPGRVFEWIGALPLGLFTGRHRLEVQAHAEGTRLLHSEAFSGLAPWLGKTSGAQWWSANMAKTRANFERANEELKRHAEALHAR